MLPLILLLGIAQQDCSNDRIMRIISAIAADSMAGRAPGSPGDTKTTDYLKRELEAVVGSPGRVSFQEVPLDSADSRTSRNVIASIPGGRDEWVMVTAHHDGLGIGKPDARGDSIYNGANDNAAGVALAICLAGNLAPPAGRRGVIVVLTAAEERGHIGARYWAEHPTIPLEKIKLAVNLDALGVTGPTLDFIAYGNGLLVGTDSLLPAAGARAGFELTTVSFESRMYWAFDSAELGAVGVPAITVGQGTRPPQGSGGEPPPGFPPLRQQYHSPADEVAADWSPAAIRRYGELAGSIVEAARTHPGVIQLKSPNAYLKRP